MKLNVILASILVIVFISGCYIQLEEQVEEPAVEEPVTEEVEEEPVVEEVVEEPVELTCEEKAAELIPETLKLTLPNEKDPEEDGWTLTEDNTWADDEEISFKGDVIYRKGRLEDENTNYYYTVNTQNEKLFGVGGMKYSVKVTKEDGTVGRNEFIVKPVLQKLNIVEPEEPFAPYVGSFLVLDPGFVECSWAD
jgi:preprotein translocase subunit SecD